MPEVSPSPCGADAHVHACLSAPTPRARFRQCSTGPFPLHASCVQCEQADTNQGAAKIVQAPVQVPAPPAANATGGAVKVGGTRCTHAVLMSCHQTHFLGHSISWVMAAPGMSIAPHACRHAPSIAAPQSGAGGARLAAAAPPLGSACSAACKARRTTGSPAPSSAA